MNTKDLKDEQKVKKIFVLLFLILFLLLILIFSFFNTITKDRKLPTIEIEKKEFAGRGSIISKDNFKISSTKKLYKASIDTRYLDENKKNLFVTLFSIYSGKNYEKILQKINDSLKNKGYIVLSYDIDSRSAKNLKELSYSLLKLQVFNSIHNNTVGLSIDESGESRVYSYKDTLTPLVGYIQKYEDNKHTKVKGIKGLEKSFENILSNSKDGVLRGNRDAISYIIFDKKATIEKREDGYDVYLNIPLKLQKNIEFILDKYKEKFEAQEIIASIMDSKTGNILTLASSNRFNPENIKQEDIPDLNVKAIEYPFEPGSIIKPITISLVLDKNKVKKNKLFFAYNNYGLPNIKGEYPKGRYKLDKYTINDDHNFRKNYLTIDDILIYSSNIGTLQLAQKLSGPEFLNGLHSFGFDRKTNIELPYEKTGQLPPLKQLSYSDQTGDDNIFKATVSYGQGMTSTFMQVLKAYTVFNNDGNIVSPKLLSYLNNNNNKYSTKDEKSLTIISKETADEIKRLLIKTVEEGTGKAAQIDGLMVGGKTGTAQIAKRGAYQKEYISSFFGFANDYQDRSYTIGVTVFDPKFKYHYASQSAVPVFKELIDVLLRLDYLKSSQNMSY